MFQSTRLHIVIFLSVTFLVLGSPAGILLLKNHQINKSNEIVSNTRDTISQTREMLATVNGTLAIQRGYLLSGNRELLEEYDVDKTHLTDTLAKLKTLTAPNPAQTSRMVELQHHYLAFTEILDAMVQKYKTDRNLGSVKDMTRINEIRKEFNRVANLILQDEYTRQTDEEHKLEKNKAAFNRNLIISIILIAAILTILTTYLLRTRQGRTVNEDVLKEAEERLRLAIRGTNDGVYDWNLLTQDVYWSPQFKDLLGYQDDEIAASRPFLESLMHPDDKQYAMETTQKYLNRESPELSCIFRVKHKSGRWIWVNKRGKALFDEDGRPMRLIGTYSDVSSLKEYEARLEEAKDIAEKANAAKTEFLAHMSHEIRTPLTSISGVSEILSNQSKDFNPRQQQLVKVLGLSTTNLKELINDILDFSKIESGQMDLEEKPFGLSELFQEVISTMAVRAQEKGLKFSFDYEPVRNVKFLGDKIRLRQILMNLIGNALKFTHEGSVDVTVTRITSDEGEPFMQIVVKDSGIGIDIKNYELVFERFRQADASVSRKYGGSGLGLAISKNLVERMGGEISLESEVEKGSTFTVTMPLREVDAANDAGITAHEGIIHKLKVGQGQKSRILLVEDYEGNIVVLSYILESLGCEFEVARTGLEAINLWKKSSPDLILMDVQMPEMDGLTATRQIRKMEEEQGLQRTPIIGMTAHAFVEDKDKCTQAGMDSYLAKPIVENDLIGEISKYLEQKEARRERQASSGDA